MTGTASARRSSRSPSRGSRATGWVCGSASPELPALLVSHHRPGFYMRVIKEGQIEAGDEIVRTRTGPHALTVADADALLYLPGRDQDKLRVAVRHPGAEPRLAAILPGTARRGRPRRAAAGPDVGTEPSARPGPAWAGFRPLRVTRVVRETATSRRSTWRRRRQPAPARPGRAVPDAAGRGRRAARPGTQLLALVRARRRRVPHQRQARTARRRQRYLNKPAAGRGHDRRRRAPRRVRARRRRRPGAADLCGHRRDAGPVDAAPARRRPQRARHLVDLRCARAARAAASPTRRTRCSLRCRALTSTSSTARPPPRAPREPRRARPHHHRHSRGAGAAGQRGRLHLRSGRVHGQRAGRARRGGHRRRTASTPSCSARCRRSTPASPARTARRRTSRPARRNRAHGDLRPQRTSSHAVPAGPGSLLELAEACDVPTRWSCRTGVCHTCITPLLSGDVTYDPDAAGAARPRRGAHLLLPARTDVVLDM